MKAKKVSSRSKTNKNDSTAADPLEMEKQRLKRQIVELQTLILQAERQNIDVTRFGDVTNAEQLLPISQEHRVSAKVPDVELIFRKEMYTHGGFYCAKVTDSEYVFNFACCEEGGQSGETFSVQIWNRGGKGSLGHWVMPMCVDMQKILEAHPIDNLAMVIPFLKNCKQQVNCYGERKKQIQEFKNHISDAVNCEIDANIGFTLITLRLCGVYSKPKDSYVDLTITLSYKSNETRPSVLDVDWNLKKDPSTSQTNQMKTFAKFLRNQRILEGFLHMNETVHPVYQWSLDHYVESPLELNNSSEDSEELESILVTAGRRRKKIVKKRKQNRELQARWKKRQRQSSLVTRSHDRISADEEKEDSAIENSPSRATRSSTRSLDRSKSPDKSNEPLKPRKSAATRSSTRSLDRPKSPDKSKEPLKHSKSAAPKNKKIKPSRKLRQTTITFAGIKSMLSKTQNSTNAPVEKTSKVVADESSKTENSKSAKSKTKKSSLAKGKVSQEKAEKKAESIEVTPVSSRVRKSAIPREKPASISILSVEKIKPKKILRAATSTPLQKTVQNKVKFAAMTISPIASDSEENRK